MYAQYDAICTKFKNMHKTIYIYIYLWIICMWWKYKYMHEIRANLGYWLPLGQHGVGRTAGSVISCFLEKIWNKCGKMLRLDIFQSTCCIILKIWSNKVFLAAPAFYPFCWGPDTDPRSFKPSHNLYLIYKGGTWGSDREMACPRQEVWLGPRFPNLILISCTWKYESYAVKANWGFFELSGGLDS